MRTHAHIYSHANIYYMYTVLFTAGKTALTVIVRQTKRMDA